jgi:hypothetical protein
MVTKVTIHTTQATLQTQKNVCPDLWIGNKYVRIKKSMKLPKSVNRRTDNTMAKKEKGKSTIYNTQKA